MQWIFKTSNDRKLFSKQSGSGDLPPSSYVVVSNYEAENLTQYLSSSLIKKTIGVDFPKLYSFISLIRNEQLIQHLKLSALGHVPASLHLLAGSIHAEKVIWHDKKPWCNSFLVEILQIFRAIVLCCIVISKPGKR